MFRFVFSLPNILLVPHRFILPDLLSLDSDTVLRMLNVFFNMSCDKYSDLSRYVRGWCQLKFPNNIGLGFVFWILPSQASDINSSPPSAAYMRQWTGSTLVQVMACRLFGAKPLPEPMLDYCQLDPWEQISVKSYSKFIYFNSRKCD